MIACYRFQNSDGNVLIHKNYNDQFKVQFLYSDSSSRTSHNHFLTRKMVMFNMVNLLKTMFGSNLHCYHTLKPSAEKKLAPNFGNLKTNQIRLWCPDVSQLTICRPPPPLRSGHRDIKDAQYAEKIMDVKYHIAFGRCERSKGAFWALKNSRFF